MSGTTTEPTPGASGPAGPRPAGSVQPLLHRLKDSERALLDHKVARGQLTDFVRAQTPSTKDVEFGHLLSLLNNAGSVKDEHLRVVIDRINAYIAQNGLVLPPSELLGGPFEALGITFSVLDDGTIVGTGQYEELDPNWLLCLWNLIVTCEIGGYFGLNGSGGWKPLQVPGSDQGRIRATSRSGARSITVGLVSDWGTGDPGGYPNAARVIAGFGARNPDYAVHLGDVYYAGTPSTEPSQSDFWRYDPLGEESGNMLALWPAALSGRSFALNSNHEMYSGAYGLFGSLLTGAGPFAAQGAFSVFALAVGDWTILGLDTAYESSMDNLYMDGRIGQGQQDWIAGLKLDASKTIVLTHHTGLDYDGTYQPGSTAAQSYQRLWDQLRQALGGDPYAWYWGHVHNGIVYNTGQSTVTVPTAAPGGDRAARTYCRCLGHGALPFASAPGLAGGGKPVAWYVQNEPGAELALNGYVTLAFDLDAGGVCRSITEAFWSCDPNASGPIWTNPLLPATS